MNWISTKHMVVYFAIGFVWALFIFMATVYRTRIDGKEKFIGIPFCLMFGGLWAITFPFTIVAAIGAKLAEKEIEED